MPLEPAGLKWMNENLPGFLDGVSRANKAIGGMGKEGATAATGISQLDAQSGKAKKSLLDFSNVTGMVKGALAAWGISIGLREIKQFGEESILAYQRLAAGKGALRATVDSVEAYNEVITKAREATRSMVPEAQLASSANVLLASGLAQSSSEAAQLINAGNILTGVFATNGATLEKFVRLLASGNLVLYDNFGLTLDMVQARQREIETTQGLSGQEARLAAIRALLLDSAEKYKGSVSDAEVASRAWQAAAEDLKAALGEELAPAATQAAISATQAVRSFTQGKAALAEQREAILRTSQSFSEYSQRLRAAGLALDMTRQEFDGYKMAIAATAEAVTGLEHEERRLTAAYGDSVAAIQVVEQERGRAMTEWAQGQATAYREQDAILNEYFENRRKEAEETARLAEETARDLLQSTATFFNDLRGQQEEMAASQQEYEGQLVDARAGAAEQQVGAQEQLNERLVALEQERADKIAWVMTGAHARTAEQNAEALAYWNTYYDQLEAEARGSYDTQNAEIQAKLAEREAGLAAARTKEEAEQRAALGRMKTLAALTIMEQADQLEAFTGGMATTAKDALSLIEAGVLPLSRDMALEIQTLMGDMAATNEQATQRAGTNATLLSQALAGDLEATARPAVQNLDLDLQSVADTSLPGLQTAGTTTSTMLAGDLETLVRPAIQNADLDFQNVTMLTLPALQTTTLTVTAAMVIAIQTVSNTIQSLDTQVKIVVLDIKSAGVEASATAKIMVEKFKDASDKIQEELIPVLRSIKVWLDSIKQAAEDASDAMGGIGPPPGGGGGAQFGADFIVPPGFPRDTFPLRVSSGERVIVVPRGETTTATTQNIFNLNVSTRDTARAVVGEFEIMRALIG